MHGLTRELLVLWLQIVTQVPRRGQGCVTDERCKTEIYLQWKTNRKLYVSYQMAATAVTLNDPEGHSPVAGLFKCNSSKMWSILHDFNWQCVSWASCMNWETRGKIIHKLKPQNSPNPGRAKLIFKIWGTKIAPKLQSLRHSPCEAVSKSLRKTIRWNARVDRCGLRGTVVPASVTSRCLVLSCRHGN